MAPVAEQVAIHLRLKVETGPDQQQHSLHMHILTAYSNPNVPGSLSFLSDNTSTLDHIVFLF